MWNIVGEESKGHDDLGEDAILEEFSMGSMRVKENYRMLSRFGLNKWLNY